MNTPQSFSTLAGELFVGSLKQRDLFRITVDGDRETLREAVLHDVHRLRDIATDRDGLVYVLTDSGDLLRLFQQDDRPIPCITTAHKVWRKRGA